MFFCLQEAWDILDSQPQEVRPYEWIGRKTGEGIAWNPKHLSLLAGSINSDDQYIYADFVDLRTQTIIRIASIHVNGFNLDAASQKLHPQHKDEIFTLTKNQMKTLPTILQKVRANAIYATCIIGSDTNSDPTVFSDIHNLFSQAGFQYRTPEYTTNYFPRGDLQERKLDYIFTLDKTATQTPFPLHDSTMFCLNHVDNPSDHLPVINQIEVQTSLIRRIATFVTGFISFFLSEFSQTPVTQETTSKLPFHNLSQMHTLTLWGRVRHSLLAQL